MHVFSDTIKKADTALKLLKIDPLKKNIYKPPDALDVGMGAKLHLSTYKKTEKYKGSLVPDFHKGIILLLSNITAHMIEKCPLKHEIVRYASCSNPNTLALSAKNESSKLKFSKMLVKLTALKQISIKLEDDAKEQLSKCFNEHVPENHEKFSSFSKFDQRLDTFMSQFLRGFKANKDFFVENQSEDSFKSLRIISDHLTSKNVQARNNHYSRYDQASKSCKRALQNVSK